MNWTGGYLQRHSTSRASSNNHQRQHFAKVRQKLRHPIKTISPIKFSPLYINKIDHRSAININSASSVSHGLLKCSNQFVSEKLQSQPGNAPLNESKELIENNVNQNSPHLSEERKCTNSPPKDISTEVTPSLAKVRTSKSRSAEVGITKVQIKQEDFIIKSQKILQMQDWVGIATYKSAQRKIVFSPNIDNTSRNSALKENQFTLYDHFVPSVLRRDGRPEKFHEQAVKKSLNSSPYRAEVPLGMKVNVIHSREKSNSISSCSKSSTIFLDHMSGETQSAQGQDTPLLVTGRIHKLSRSHLRQIELEKKSLDSHESLQVKRHYSDRSLSQNRQVDHFSFSSKDRSWSFSTLGTDSSLNVTHQRSCITSSPPDALYTSSVAHLHHPIPRSSKISSLLETSSSNEANRSNETLFIDSSPLKIVFADRHHTQSIISPSNLNHEVSSNEKKSLYLEETNYIQDQCADMGFFIGKKSQSNKNKKRKMSSLGKSPKFFTELSSQNLSSIILSKQKSSMISESKRSPKDMMRKNDGSVTHQYQGTGEISTIYHQHKTRNRDPDKLWKMFVFGNDLGKSEFKPKANFDI